MIMAKVGDTVVGTCICSTPPYPDIGIIAVGDPTQIDTGRPIARVGDSVIFSCGTSVIVSGSFTDFAAGQPAAKVGDSVQGCGQGIITATGLNLTM